jgi:hypothetical protein
MADTERHRALSSIVWVGRTTGWAVISLAIFSALQIGAFTQLPSALKLLQPAALGVLGIAWLVGLELFVRSLYRPFSRY